MSDGRFQPPRAAVADPPVPPPPRTVKAACLLLVVSVVLSFISFFVDLRSWPSDTWIPLAGLVILVPMGTVMVWLATMLWQRRNWARWALLPVSSGGWLLGLSDDPEWFLSSVGAIYAGAMITESAVLGLVFFGPGARWFKDRPQASRAHSAAS